MRIRLSAILTIFVGLLPHGHSSAAEPARGYRLIVSAGAWNRQHTVVSFRAPPSLPQSFDLLDAHHHVLPAQRDKHGKIWFVLDHLTAGTTASYTLVSRKKSSPVRTHIRVRQRPDRLEMSDDGQVLFDYHEQPAPLPRKNIPPIYRRGGYIHPVYSPKGWVVTDDYPPNHIHHHGIWFAWTHTEFEGRHPDFWNMGQGLGRVEFVKLDRHWDGAVIGGFVAEHRYVDLTEGHPVIALKETWKVQAYHLPWSLHPYWQFDLTSVQRCAGPHPLILPPYRYGGIGIRGNRAWNGAAKAFFLTSRGITNRVAGNRTRARWCYIGGLIEGHQAGAAILCHPDNFRAPQPLRLHPDMPYFCYAPEQLGPMEIRPGQKYVSRYRFIILDGKPDRAMLDRLWNDYAHPPKVRIQDDTER